MKFPRTANMKKINKSKKKTFNKDGTENMIVWIIACRFFALPASLTILKTLSTLISLAIVGAAEKLCLKAGGRKSKTTSKTLAETTKKSN